MLAHGAEFLSRKGIKLLNPPDSPYLAPANFGLFPGMKKILAGCCYSAQKELETAVERCIRKLCKNETTGVFQRCLKGMEKCVNTGGGDYIEK